MPVQPAEVRKLAVGQWAKPVRFQETVESMYGAGVRLFMEVGPKANLSSFVSDTLKGKRHLAVASNVHYRSGTTQLNHALCAWILSIAAGQCGARNRTRQPGLKGVRGLIKQP